MITGNYSEEMRIIQTEHARLLTRLQEIYRYESNTCAVAGYSDSVIKQILKPLEDAIMALRKTGGHAAGQR